MTSSRPDATVQVAILTGQSNPASCALSPVQAAFLSQVVDAGAGAWRRVDRNFPYGELGEPHRDIPVLPASLANGRQYLASRGGAFRARHRAAVEQLLLQAPRTVILAGSCGLELFVNLELPAALQQRCAILAYGPTARRVPATTVEVVVGHRDWISQALFAVPDDVVRHVVECGHRDYLVQPAMLALSIDFVRRMTESATTALAGTAGDRRAR